MMNLLLLIIFSYQIVNIFGAAPADKTIANYDPSELLLRIFNTNNTVDTTVPRAGYGLIQFEQQPLQQDFVRFGDQNNGGSVANDNTKAVKFNDDNGNPYTFGNHDFQSGIINEYISQATNKRRRRRKPKQNGPFQYPQAVNPGFGYGFGSYPPFVGQYKPRPRPSAVSQALTSVTEALTSIALYDDYQCVARLLCEAAGGGGLGNSGILQTVSGLQPLLTLLSAYSGVSSNPLFVFGRAVFLGMSSKGNPASCRYGYPLCPTDPEELVHYLNNHNGGFFRFFNAPQQGNQNIEQFYNQLSQNYGPQYNQNNNQQSGYGLYNGQQYTQNNLVPHRPNLYSDQQGYGFAYPYNNSNVRFKDNQNFNEGYNKIEKRIQNRPDTNYVEDIVSHDSKLAFPESGDKYTLNDNYYINDNGFSSYDANFNDNYFNSDRKGNTLKFPEVYSNAQTVLHEYDRKIRGFSFPETHEYNHYSYNSHYTKPISTYASNNRYVNKNNLYTKQGYYNYNNNENNEVLNGIQTVYVVRGNGDPNHPEIVKLRPGESVL